MKTKQVYPKVTIHRLGPVPRGSRRRFRFGFIHALGVVILAVAPAAFAAF